MTDHREPAERDDASYEAGRAAGWTAGWTTGFQAGWRNGIDSAAAMARISVREVYPNDPLLDLFEAEFQQQLDKYGKAA